MLERYHVGYYSSDTQWTLLKYFFPTTQMTYTNQKFGSQIDGISSSIRQENIDVKRRFLSERSNACGIIVFTIFEELLLSKLSNC